jgi:RES domain
MVDEVPAEGVVRVHPEPGALPRLRHEGRGQNRFDDPEGTFVMRYAASTLRGCLVETMARFRPRPRAEALLNQIEDLDEQDLAHEVEQIGSRAEAVGEWLAAQKLGLLKVDSSGSHRVQVIDIDDPNVLDQLDKHPAVRQALEESGLGTDLDPARLDAGVIRIGGPVGRPITQAVARAVLDWLRGDVIAYWSRLDSSERCWAIYDHVPVDVSESTLNAGDPTIYAAVTDVAARFEIPLSEPWV